MTIEGLIGDHSACRASFQMARRSKTETRSEKFGSASQAIFVAELTGNAKPLIAAEKCVISARGLTFR